MACRTEIFGTLQEECAILFYQTGVVTRRAESAGPWSKRSGGWPSGEGEGEDDCITMLGVLYVFLYLISTALSLLLCNNNESRLSGLTEHAMAEWEAGAV